MRIILTHLWYSCWTLILIANWFIGHATAQQLVLKHGDRLAIVGDSITEQKLYSKFIETYLLACHPELDIQTYQFGWGGERAPGFASRIGEEHDRGPKVVRGVRKVWPGCVGCRVPHIGPPHCRFSSEGNASHGRAR